MTLRLILQTRIWGSHRRCQTNDSIAHFARCCSRYSQWNCLVAIEKSKKLCTKSRLKLHMKLSQSCLPESIAKIVARTVCCHQKHWFAMASNSTWKGNECIHLVQYRIGGDGLMTTKIKSTILWGISLNVNEGNNLTTILKREGNWTPGQNV